MGRQVKLHDTGLMGDSSVNFKSPSGKYYTTKDAYLKVEKNKKNRQLCINKMYDLMDYASKMILPTYFYKKLKEYDGIGYESVLAAMYSQEKNIRWALANKQLGSETAKVMYTMAIIDNNVMDEYKRIVREEREIKREDSVDTVVDDMDISNNATKKTKDISKWVED